jgi:hypothetical protein
VVIVYLPDEAGEMVHFSEIRVHIREEGMILFCIVDREGSIQSIIVGLGSPTIAYGLI